MGATTTYTVKGPVRASGYFPLHGVLDDDFGAAAAFKALVVESVG
jgi:hypothetical protein